MMKSWTILICLMAFGLGHCGNDDSDDTEETTEESSPTVPPAGTLAISPGFSQSLTAGLNWLAAAAIVTTTQVVVFAQLAVPAAALEAALAQTPVSQGGGVWLWSYDFTSSEVNYQAKLTGTATATNAASWSFKVSRSPADANSCCTDFEWIVGSTSSLTNGTWTIRDHETPSALSDVRTVTWTFNSQTDKNLVIRLDKEPSNDSDWKQNGSVTWNVSGTSKTLTLDQDPSNTEKTIITWDTETNAGSHTKNDGSKVCWDSSLNDTTCP